MQCGVATTGFPRRPNGSDTLQCNGTQISGGSDSLDGLATSGFTRRPNGSDGLQCDGTQLSGGLDALDGSDGSDAERLKMTDIHDTTRSLTQRGACEAFDYATAAVLLSTACCWRIAGLIKIAPEAV